MMRLTAKTCSRLPELHQGSALFLLSWAAYAAAYVGRYNYSAVMGAVTAEGTLSLSAAGAVSTGYFICYALGQIVCGALSQCVAPYGMIFAGLMLSGLCNLGMGAVPGAAMPVLWALNGLFQAMIWPPIIRLFAESMPLEQQKAACININATTPAGTLAAYIISAVLLALAGWRSVFFTCGGVLLIMAVVWWIGTAPLRRVTTMQILVRPKTEKASPDQSNIMVLAMLGGLGWLVVPVALHGGLKDGVTSWVPSMTQSSFGISPAFSASVSSVLPVVNLIGAYSAGWLDRMFFKNELKTSAALFALALVSLLVMPLAVQYSMAVSVALLALTTASMLGVNTMFINAMPVRAGRKGGAAMLSGMLNAVTYLGAAVATWGIGSVAQNFGWGAVFTLWLVMAAVALAACLLLARRWTVFVRKEAQD